MLPHALPADCLLLTTNPGLEDIVADECRETWGTGASLQEKPFGLDGQVLLQWQPRPADWWSQVQALRSVHHVWRLLHVFRLDSDDHPLQHIYNAVAGTDVAEMESAESFRVTTTRLGTHEFNSEEAAAVAGSALFHHYGTRVDLTRYDVNVRVNVYDQTVLVGVQLTDAALSKRHNAAYHHRAGLRPNIAYAMLQMARLAPDAVVLDPFCGSGTILQEAAALSSGWTVVGSDQDADAVVGAHANLAAAARSDRVVVRVGDARFLRDQWPANSVDAIVTNPPYGGRIGRFWDFNDLYVRFLTDAHHILKPSGKIVMLVWKRGLFRRVVDRFGLLHIRHVRIVETGGIYPGIFVLEKAPESD